MNEPVYSTSSTRWDCTCPPATDLVWSGHYDDCPEARRRTADEEEWRRVLEDIAEIDEKRAR